MPYGLFAMERHGTPLSQKAVSSSVLNLSELVAKINFMADGKVLQAAGNKIGHTPDWHVSYGVCYASLTSISQLSRCD
ncbi:hypothetical protein LOSG293_420060 [Secundilactobacillus oryzae JCM 18671]|uniref:Uncharacterized protein n=1 Tax=Secundilactobacillus oryzae JCM 18671 TaxID=1291743 RepID=A0A081BKQ2_9LACO|nr:hypothetical protein LOSG293_420060 [Secundilactobacillus oryzae JCM 18671]